MSEKNRGGGVLQHIEHYVIILYPAQLEGGRKSGTHNGAYRTMKSWEDKPTSGGHGGQGEAGTDPLAP